MPKPIPTVAIVTRTRGRNSVLSRAIESVDNQTFSDYVHVIVNDGGDREGVEAILAEHPSKARVVVHNKSSIGVTPALNQGIRQAESKYVAILDDDDSWSNDRLEVAIRYMEEHQSLGTASVMDKLEETVKEDGTIEEVSRNRWRPDITNINLYEQCLENHLSNGCFIYSRDVYNELDGYDESLEVAEDWDFGMRFLQRYDVDFIETNHALVNYHLRPKASGAMGNSVFDGIKRHERAINKILNKHLRKDLEAGSLGIGYMINNLKFTQKRLADGIERDLESVVRLEAHINRLEESLKRFVIDTKQNTLYNFLRSKIKR